MAATIKNSDLVSKEDLDSLKSLDAQLVSSAEAMEKLLVKTQQISTDLSKSAKSYKELVDVISKYEKVTVDSDNTLKKAKVTMSEIDKLKEKLIKSNSDEAKTIAELRVQLEQNNRVLKNNAKENQAAEGSLNELRAALIRMRIEYDAMGKRARESAYGKFLAEDINKANQEVLKLESATGRFGRNVGNYASGFNSLGFSIQQIARELPSLSISINQLFLAISNNVPIAVDEFKKAQAAYKAAMIEGGEAAKNAISPTKAVIASIFSWQTALVVGLTLFSAYGKQFGEFIKQIITGSSALKTTKEIQEDINKEFLSGSKKIGEQIVKVKDLADKWKDLGDDLKKQKQFIVDNKTEFDSLGLSIVSVKDAELLLESKTDSFIESLKRRALAASAFKLAANAYDDVIAKEIELQKITEEGISFADKIASAYSTQVQAITAQQSYDMRINGMKNQIKTAKDNASAIFDLGRAYEKEAEDELKSAGLKEKTKIKKDKSTENAAKTAIEALKRRKEDESKALDEINEINFKSEADTQKRILENELKSYQERMVAANEFENKMGDSINSRADKQITGLEAEYRRLSDIAKKGGQNIGTFEEEFGNEIILINEKRNLELNKISLEGSKIREDILKDSLSSQQKILEALYTERNLVISKNEDDELLLLAQSYSKNGKKQEDYEKEKLNVTLKYSKERFDAEIRMLKDLLDISALSDEQKLAVTKKINEAELRYNKEVNDRTVKNEENTGKKRIDTEKEVAKKRIEILKELGEEALKLYSTIADAETERNLEKLEKQSEDNQDWRDRELENIERLEDAGAISKEQAEARKKLVDDQAKEREKQIDQEKKRIQIEQAKRNKLIALAEAGINTAKAITSVLPNFVLAALVGALGALQIGTILTTQIPQYAKGTDNHRGGLGIVGDGGRHEMVITPSGEIFKTPNVSTLVDMPKGTTVLPDYSKALASMNAQKLPKEASDNVTIFESVKQIRKIDEGNKLLKQLNQNMNLGNQAIQREILSGNNSKYKIGLSFNHK